MIFRDILAVLIFRIYQQSIYQQFRFLLLSRSLIIKLARTVGSASHEGMYNVTKQMGSTPYKTHLEFEHSKLNGQVRQSPQDKSTTNLWHGCLLHNGVWFSLNRVQCQSFGHGVLQCDLFDVARVEGSEALGPPVCKALHLRFEFSIGFIVAPFNLASVCT